MNILNEAGYRTIAPDQRGYSEGARPKGRRKYNVSELALDIVQLIQELNVGSVRLVGHDWGSFVGSNVAGKYPELVKTWISVSLPHPKHLCVHYSQVNRCFIPGICYFSNCQLFRNFY